MDGTLVPGISRSISYSRSAQRAQRESAHESREIKSLVLLFEYQVPVGSSASVARGLDRLDRHINNRSLGLCICLSDSFPDLVKRVCFVSQFAKPS